jgi:hypothetical protein
MIRNNDELKVVQKQLSRIKSALSSLRRRVSPKNKRNFEVLSEGYVDTIAELSAQIDAYRAVAQKNGEAKTKPARAHKDVRTTAEKCGRVQ